MVKIENCFGSISDITCFDLPWNSLKILRGVKCACTHNEGQVALFVYKRLTTGRA